MPTTATTDSSLMPVGPSDVAQRPDLADEALLTRLREGDVEAGERLVSRHGVALIRYLRRLTGNESLAEELHQQTWLSVLEHASRFTTVAGGFKAWLYRIATNKANDQWRSMARDRAAKQSMRLVVDEALPAADSRLDAREQEAKLQQAIDTLPDVQRKVLLLRYYSNLKFVEIAEVMGCPLNTALGRMHKAMLSLKKLLAG